MKVSTPFRLALFFLTACSGSSDDVSTSTSTAALQCFHTPSQIACKEVTGSAEERTKIEDYYPSACLDGDADADGVPDFLDVDFIGTETAEIRDELRCPKCNRGPGTQNDFRLRIEGDVAELQRGKVYLRDGNQLSIPTPEGVLEVVITAQTEIDDGEPAPGAEIRVEGTIVGNVVEATRLKVLCPAPAPIPDAETPPGTEPPTPEPSGPLL